MPTVIRVIVDVSGGLVQGVLVEGISEEVKLDLSVLDFDNMECEPQEEYYIELKKEYDLMKKSDTSHYVY